MAMVEKIWETAGGTAREKGVKLVPLAGRAEALPFADASLSVLLASSMVHHPASFEDHGELGPAVVSFFAEASRVLTPGGRLVIRDFMQDEYPYESLFLRVGKKVRGSDVDPGQFIADFADSFHLASIDGLRKQVQTFHGPDGRVKGGSYLKVPSWLATELAAHYSWANPRFREEVKERYAYKPPKEYALFVRDVFAAHGVRASIISANATILPGYPAHVNGRLDFFSVYGDLLDAPPVYTGVIVVEKQ
jgi:SAM-dependent methyltransferase